MKHILLLVAALLLPTALYAAHGDQFTIDAGILASANDELCRKIAASDGLETIICAGEHTYVFEKTNTGWSIFSLPFNSAVTADITFDGSRFVMATGSQTYVYGRDTHGTPDRSDDTWHPVAGFTNGASAAIAHLNGDVVMVGDYNSRTSTVYCGPTWSPCNTINGYAPIAMDALGVSIAATDPITDTVYYKAGGSAAQHAVTGEAASDFGYALTFGTVGTSYLIIGAPKTKNAGGFPAGSCYVYALAGSSEEGWRFDPFGRINAPTGLTDARFCDSVSMWTSISDVLIGAPFADVACPVDNAACNAGAAYLYEDAGKPLIRFDPPHEGADMFGWGVFVQRIGPGQGEYHIISEPWSDRLDNNAGEAHIQEWSLYIFTDGFESGSTCSWMHTCPGG